MPRQGVAYRRWTIAVMVLALLFTSVAAGGQAAGAATDSTIMITGSPNLYSLGAVMAQRYTGLHPVSPITIQPTTGDSGFDDACAGRTQIGLSATFIQDAQLRRRGCADMLNIPVALGGLTVVYNLPGPDFVARTSDKFTPVTPVRLSWQVARALYLGARMAWNDPAIVALNPHLSLPAQRIRVFVTAEQSRAGAALNQWLELATATTPNAIAGPSTRGAEVLASSGAMVEAIRQTPYSLGVVGFDYAVSNALQAAAVENASGRFLTPSPHAFYRALLDRLRAGLSGDFRSTLVNTPGQSGYPLTYLCYALTHRHLRALPQTNLATRKAIKAFLTWMISHDGQPLVQQIELAAVIPPIDGLQHSPWPVSDTVSQAIRQLVAGIEV